VTSREEALVLLVEVEEVVDELEVLLELVLEVELEVLVELVDVDVELVVEEVEVELEELVLEVVAVVEVLLELVVVEVELVVEVVELVEPVEVDEELLLEVEVEVGTNAILKLVPSVERADGWACTGYGGEVVVIEITCTLDPKELIGSGIPLLTAT
jgi:hypothetical protein